MRRDLLPALILVCLPAFAQQKALRILEANCLSCHGAAKMGGLDLRTRAAAVAGGARGPALRPGHAAESLIYQAPCSSRIQ